MTYYPQTFWRDHGAIHIMRVETAWALMNRNAWLAGLVFLFSTLFSSLSVAIDSEVRIGVLALRGVDRATQNWSATAAYLENKLPDQRFRIVPLGFDEIHLAVRQRSVEFVLANPSFYVELESLYGVSPVATMRNRHHEGQGFSQFGGVIFTRADRAKIHDLSGLKGRAFVAVDKESFGGWHAAWRELLRHGIKPESDFKSLSFAGTHDAVVYAVRDGKADAGTVRTDTLERMAMEGAIDLSDFFILGERRQDDFPLLHSTELYPEWPLAKLKHVSDALAVRVAVALMQMPPDDAAAKAGQIVGWTLPLNYQAVHETLRALKIGPYLQQHTLSLAEVMALYGHWVVLALIFLLLALLVAVYVSRINRRLRQHQRELGLLNSDLEARVRERTDRVESLLERERYLRGILAMVADVNEILITTDSQEEMLKACCDRLVANSNYRFSWVSLLLEGELTAVVKSYGSAELSRKLRFCLGGGPATIAVRDNHTVILTGNEVGSEILEAGVSSVASLPLRRDAYADAFGALCVLTTRVDGFDAEEVAMLEQLAGDIGFAIQSYRHQAETSRLQQQRIGNYEDTILSMVDMIEKRDTYTAGHTRRVAQYCELIALQMGCSTQDVERLKGAAILHDIGKIAIPDAVLLKPGSLTGLEFDLIKQHVEVGYEALARIEMYRELAEIMRHHHERMNGCGYPAGLKGDEIPLLSRIMAVADAFDAMTTNRIYKPRISVAEALADLTRLAGSEFDLTVVDAARQVLCNVEPPSLSDQLPKTGLEKQRFAYFFNDHLTGLHNAEYLRFISKSGLDHTYGWACMVMLQHFSRYNSEQGWAAGNKLLAGFAQYLETNFPDAVISRVMGDDFVLLASTPMLLDAVQLKQFSVLRDTPVEVELKPVDLSIERLEGVLRYI
jgi:two-component system, LuxR family, sensor histidine kinase TtrS